MLKQIREQLDQVLHGCAAAAEVGVLVPVGLWGLTEGIQTPDLDISLLGIGNHRFFFFHSVLGLVVLRYFFNKWQQVGSSSQQLISRFGGKVMGTLGTYAVGVGIHLLIDTFQLKSITFPFFGSLVDGTLVDGNIWLLGNSLWAFKIGRDVFSLVLADELQAARQYVVSKFGKTPVSVGSVK